MKPEYRTTQNAQIRSRKGADGKTDGIDGYAAVFNSLSQNLGWFRERVMPGAFKDCLSAAPDVRALFNHDPNIVLGRTKSKTLRLKEDKNGLHFESDPPDTQAARDLMTLVDRGDVDQCSFGFFVRDHEWTQEPDPDDPKQLILVRNLKQCDLTDVSPVTYPAYTSTSCDVRSIFPDGVPEDLAAKFPALRAEAERAAAAARKKRTTKTTTSASATAPRARTASATSARMRIATTRIAPTVRCRTGIDRCAAPGKRSVSTARI